MTDEEKERAEDLIDEARGALNILDSTITHADKSCISENLESIATELRELFGGRQV